MPIGPGYYGVQGYGALMDAIEYARRNPRAVLEGVLEGVLSMAPGSGEALFARYHGGGCGGIATPRLFAHITSGLNGLPNSSSWNLQ